MLALACSSSTSESPALEVARSRSSAAEREWRTYLGDPASTQSSPLVEIHPGNVGTLETAWTYDAGGVSAEWTSQIQFNPLIVKGVLYGGSPSLRLFALDAATGQEIWGFQPDVEVGLVTTSRGAAYWSDGAAERIFFGAGPYLYSVDARLGTPDAAFGEQGRIDLREGLGRDLVDDGMGVIASTPPAIFEDLILMGGRVGEGEGAAPGHVRAFDARTGRMAWIFHTIPLPGEVGHETWPQDAWKTAGGANAWAGISIDAERGIAFVPTGSATPDFFGGDRQGDNLFANSLLALDARTGERRWHYQVVRHDIWDRDLPSPPNLVEIERDGRRVPAVAQVTKTGHTFLFDRETGEPLFPIREEAVEGDAVPGEWVARSQPIPVLPLPFVRQAFSLDLVTDRSPEARESVLQRIETMRYGSLFMPASGEGTIEYPGIDGGAEWGGAAWDAESGLLYVNANQVPWILQMVEVAEESSALGQGYVMACSGCHGLDMRGDGVTVPSLLDVEERMGFLDVYRVTRNGRGRMPAMGGMMKWWQSAAIAWFVYRADEEDAPSHWATLEGPKRFINAGYQKLVDLDQLPGTRPPWGTLTAIDLSSGQHRWQIPLGDYPQILAAGESGLGAESYGGPLVTAGGLLFIAGTPDARFRAFDKATGDLLWETELPHAAYATPATYEAAGRQYVVIAAGGGKFNQPSGSLYRAFALPAAVAR